MDLLAHLEAYVAAVDEASFSRAADRLGIAQPLLSRRIKTLEEHYGGLLFDRSRRQVTTTDFGVLLLPYAQDVLDRAERLWQIAESARCSAVRTVAVPAACHPAALARIIRAGTEHGIPLGVRELPPGERESGLADGSLAYALLRVAPEDAALRVPLGLATATPSGTLDDAPPAPAGARHPRPRAVHLEDLRPRRDRGAPSALPILTTAEDCVPHGQDRLSRAAARSGLPVGRIRPAGAIAGALAEMLAGRVALLCSEPFARRHGASWAPLADTSLHRGYDPGTTRRQPNVARMPDWLVALLASAVGATPTAAPVTAASRAADHDAPSRLAARG
ncbi:LysR family transcriptional regulator [Streptomyces gilvosporeus]|uniref:LysR family transcriptional regulator n=1 Tax=Streptomyces gilvosporeus TaxID=553510 RepID=A0A1V0TKW3_9ACTN|nr:LysR family transcriptional regulator [Streptomyces gilvosporeus]ARF53510.1 LysR family transcriptional regulator [Streptomyces gilvosporeus]